VNQRRLELFMGVVSLLVLLAMLKVMLHFGHFTT
jgi:hypothetical protein